MERPPTPSPQPDDSTREANPLPESRKEIPLIAVPSEEETIAQEMSELFEEDKVTHRHGSAEPEAD